MHIVCWFGSIWHVDLDAWKIFCFPVPFLGLSNEASGYFGLAGSPRALLGLSSFGSPWGRQNIPGLSSSASLAFVLYTVHHTEYLRYVE
eukprot:12403968-Karenia_brevis.AAC.1